MGFATRNVNRGDPKLVLAVSVYATYATYATLGSPSRQFVACALLSHNLGILPL